LNYARKFADVAFVLSAKYGLIEMGQVLEPYNKTLLKMSKRERQGWVKKVMGEIESRIGIRVVLAGKRYTEAIPPGAIVEEPLKGMPIGKRLSFLKGQIYG
jgi:hypothetical protein